MAAKPVAERIEPLGEQKVLNSFFNKRLEVDLKLFCTKLHLCDQGFLQPKGDCGSHFFNAFFDKGSPCIYTKTGALIF